jgi:phenylpropionate dioxygenase-like ring-hydroxylating dioxygenase large terminal subunit
MSHGRPDAPQGVPTDCWYAITPSTSVGRTLMAVRAVDRPIVIFRTETGTAVALEDRCAHRPYPLSAGRLEGDTVRCGLCGFVYDTAGQCVSVPTQARVPFGAHVQAYPVQESDGLLWIWFGEPGRARLHRMPELPWLQDPAWATVGGEAEVAAGLLLLHENFADVTQVPFVAPDISPSVLGVAPPPLEVTVTETTVSLSRDFPAAPLPAWQAEVVGCDPAQEFRTVQAGYLPSPAAWVDYWDAQGVDGSWVRLRFTQLVTPVGDSHSRLHWRVSRDFAVDDEDAGRRLADIFADYYARVLRAMETAQRVVDLDGPGPEVNVNSDAVALKVREIVTALLAEEGQARR